MKRTQSNSVGLQERRARRDRLNRRLVGYTATAGAALAIAGTAGTANAGIVVDAGFTGPITVNSGSSPVDVNIVGGTAAQFQFVAGANASLPNDHYLGVKGLGGAAILASASSIWAKRLRRGGAIGPGQGPWVAGVSSGTLAFHANQSNIAGGSFLGKTGYIGVMFPVASGPISAVTPALSEPTYDYGWIEFKGASDASQGEILGWAYETSGAAIHAGCVPEPTSLAVWALGALSAAGVAVLRRWKKEV